MPDVADSLPVPEQSQPSAPKTDTTAGKTVLIVEDEKPLSHALEMKLKHEGFVATVVTNGQDAIDELIKTKHSVVLLDLIMPQVDGFTVLGTLKEKSISVPVIVLSNLGQDEDRKKAKELGAVEYFVKSNTPISEIISSVKKTLS